MKVSDFITMLKELQSIHGGDPEVIIQASRGSTTELEVACADLRSVRYVSKDDEAWWDEHADGDQRAIKVF